MASVLECLPRGSRVAVLRLRSLGRLRAHHSRARHSETAPPGPAGRASSWRIASARSSRATPIWRDSAARTVAARAPLPPAAVPQLSRRHAQRLDDGTLGRALSAPGSGTIRQQFVYNVQIPRAQEILGVERKVHTAEHLASARCSFWARRWRDSARANCSPATRRRSPAPIGSDSRGRRDAREDLAGGALPGGRARIWRNRGHRTGFHRRPRTTTCRLSRRIAPLQGVARRVEVAAGAARRCSSATIPGPAHMAAAFGVPVVVLFGPSRPGIWGPWRTAGEVLTARGGIGDIDVGAGDRGARSGCGCAA